MQIATRVSERQPMPVNIMHICIVNDAFCIKMMHFV